MRLWRLLLLLPCFLAACENDPNFSDPDDPDSEFANVDESKADTVTPHQLAYRRVTSKTQFIAMSIDEGVLVQGRSMKFLIDRRRPSAPEVYFVNANYKDAQGKTPDSARFHYYFAQA